MDDVRYNAPSLGGADWSSLFASFLGQPQPQADVPLPPTRPAGLGMPAAPSMAAAAPPVPIPPPRPVDPPAPVAPPSFGAMPTAPQMGNTGNANSPLGMALQQFGKTIQSANKPAAQPAAAPQSGQSSSVVAALQSLLKRGLISAEQFAGAVGTGGVGAAN